MKRFNRILLDILSTSIKYHQGTWEVHVRGVYMAYNTSVQPTTGLTPLYLMFSWQALFPVDVMFGSSPVADMSQTACAMTLKHSLTTAYNHVHQRMNITFERQKQHYDKKVHGQPYNVGDFVWLSSWTTWPWSGPFEVIKRLPDATYRIVDRTTKFNWQVVHFDRLKLCPAGTHYQVLQRPLQSTPLQSSSTTTVLFGTDLQLVNEDDVPRRYPERTH